MDLLDTLVAEETWGKSDASSKSDASTASARAAESSKVLSSAGQVFLNIKKVFKRCSNLTRGKTLLALHSVFTRVLTAYAAKLHLRAEAAGKVLADSKRQNAAEAGAYTRPLFSST